VETSNEVIIGDKKLKVGIGIHDSSSSLVPYFSTSKGPFILLSTGTWCINMNPFNTENLTADQLEKDCLSYMSITGKPVKSSRLFLGHLHETAVKQITEHFNKSSDYYKNIKFDKGLANYLMDKFKKRSIFLIEGKYSRELNDQIDMSCFSSFEEAYHQLMNELCNLTMEAINLVLPADDQTKNVYITGGFSKNDLFLNLITNANPLKKVYTSEIANASALGAAFIILDSKPVLDLGLLSN
jgi:sugar (pentulose or hexulose) kinase